MQKSINVTRALNLTHDRTPSVFFDSINHRKLCGISKRSPTGELKYVKGCMVAHYYALVAISKLNRRQVLFEDDVCLPQCHISETKEALVQFMKKSRDVDLAYIGSNPAGHQHPNFDYCTHALLITPVAAKKLLKLVKWCSSIPVDVQYVQLAESKKITVMYARREGFDLARERNSWCGGILHQNNQDGSEILRSSPDF